MDINILAVGDVVGSSGLDYVARHLPTLQRTYNVAFTVVNGENVSNQGITPRQAHSILDAGADVITLGNHAFARHEILDELDASDRILRPANFAPQVPGRGWGDYDTAFGKIRVINLIGRSGGMDTSPDNPFHMADRILKEDPPKIILVDMHAEMTSEKLAMGYYLDGRVSVQWGTHTHVQTSDGSVFPKGTGYITDLGMTGPVVSVLGIKPSLSISRFLGNPRKHYEQAPGPNKLEGAIFTVDTDTGLCRDVEAVRIHD